MTSPAIPNVSSSSSQTEEAGDRPHTALIEPTSGTGEDAPLVTFAKQNLGLGIGLMLIGVFMFVTNDVMGKWLVATYTVGQILLLRSVAGFIILAPAIWREGPRTVFSPSDIKMHTLRVVMTTVEVACFYWSVSYLPLADVVTFYMATPIFVTALAGPLLGEKIEWQRLVAVFIGFGGVVVAMRPSSATFSWPALVAIFGCFVFSLTMIITRHLRSSKGIVLVSWQTLSALIFGLVVSPFHWVPPTLRDFILLGLLGVVSTLAHICVNKALKVAPASVVMPYQYTQIVWAVLLGYLIFSDWPDGMMLAGSGVIVVAGLFIFWREQSQARATKAG